MTSLHRDPRLRASDADRDAVAEQLRENAATGRLSMEEFGERLEHCYAAVTYGDLDALVDDLPGPDPYADLPVPAGVAHGAAVGWAPHSPPADDDQSRGGWAAWAAASVVCWAIWLATVISGGGLVGVWPVWVTIPWGGVLLAGELTSGGHRPRLPGGAGEPPSRPRRLGR
jgi:hypothetical protein